jgi:hypothetical protein
MANTIQILVETVDKTGGGFNSILSKLGMSDEKIEQINAKLPGMAAKFTLVSAAVGAVVKFTKEAVDETIKYGDEMNDLSLVTGQSAEDMSRLAGAAERFGVDYKTLSSGLATATKNGVDTSIESLLTLADQYNAIKDPIEQARFMTERFGAAGPEMAKIFRRGSDDIKSAIEDIKASLAWGTDDQAVIDDYTYALVELKQTFSALKIEVGLAVMPVITGFLEILNGEGKTTLGSTQTEVEVLANKYSGLAGTAGGANIVLENTAVRLNNIAVGALGAQSGIDDVGESSQEQSEAIWHFANGAWSLVAGLRSIPGNYDAYVTVHYSFEGTDSRDAGEWANPPAGAGAPWMGGNWNPWDSYNWNTGAGGPGGANGLDFVVPPGFPNDSFPFRAQSGERVQVTPNSAVGSGVDIDGLARAIGREVVEGMIQSGYVR